MKLFYRFLLLGLLVLLGSESIFGQIKVYKMTQAAKGFQVDEVPINYVEVPFEIDVSELPFKNYKLKGTKDSLIISKANAVRGLKINPDALSKLGNSNTDVINLFGDDKLMMRLASGDAKQNMVPLTSADSYQPGNIFNDAQKLYYQTVADKLIVESILAFYNVNNTEYDNLNLVARDALLSDGTEKGVDFSDFLSGKASGGFDATNIIVGITDFLVERGKQELSIAFFDRFKQDLKDYPELTFLFPKSSNIINSIETYNIVNVLPQLREAFIKDLLSTPENILDLQNFVAADCSGARPNRVNDCLERSKIISAWFIKDYKPNLEVILPLKVASGLMQGKNVIDIMNSISGDHKLCEAGGDVNSSIKLSYMLMEGLRSTNPNEVFVSKSQVDFLVNDEKFMKLWLLLIESKFKTVECYKDLNIGGKSIDVIFDDLDKIGNLCTFGLEGITTINTAWKEYANLKDSTAEKKATAWLGVMSASIDAIQKTQKTMMSVLFDSSGNSKMLETLSANLDIIQDMITDIQSKNYPGLFTEMLLLFETNDWLKNKANGESTLHTKFYNYLSLASSMATAKTSDEVKNALESAALPAGSYRLKQQSRFSMMVNGYIGYAWDIEMTQAKNVYGRGIYAPVGVSLSWGLRKYDIGVFASAFDFGSIASYRIQNETDTIQQKFAFESLFSPGMHASIRLLKPIVLSVGVRTTPKLFYNDSAGELIVKPQQTTLNVGLLIDIPIFNLKSTPIDKRK